MAVEAGGDVAIMTGAVTAADSPQARVTRTKTIRGIFSKIKSKIPDFERGKAMPPWGD